MKLMKQTILAYLLLMITLTISAQGYKLPAYEKFKLPNGLTVYMMEQHEVPVISVSAFLPAGAIYDGEKSGLASLTATALKHGTKNYPKAKLDEDTGLHRCKHQYIRLIGMCRSVCKVCF